MSSVVHSYINIVILQESQHKKVVYNLNDKTTNRNEAACTVKDDN